MDEREQLYINGFIQKKFKSSESLTRLVKAMKEIRDGDFKPGFELKEGKYKYSADLQPNTFSYDPAFADVFFENNILEHIREITGKNVYLGAMTLRIAYPGPSYMDWHRDTYFHLGKYHILKGVWKAARNVIRKDFAHKRGPIIGPVPPPYKLICYPALGETPQPSLRVLRGSHRRMFNDPDIDRLQTKYMPQDVVMSSDEDYVLFEHSLFHGAIMPPQDKRGVVRLIYGIVYDFLLEKNEFDYDPKLQEFIKNRY